MRFRVPGSENGAPVYFRSPAAVRLHRLAFGEQCFGPGVPLRFGRLVRDFVRLVLQLAFAECRSPRSSARRLAGFEQRNRFVPRHVRLVLLRLARSFS